MAIVVIIVVVACVISTCSSTSSGSGGGGGGCCCLSRRCHSVIQLVVVESGLMRPWSLSVVGAWWWWCWCLGAVVVGVVGLDASTHSFACTTLKARHGHKHKTRTSRLETSQGTHSPHLQLLTVARRAGTSAVKEHQQLRQQQQLKHH